MIPFQDLCHEHKQTFQEQTTGNILPVLHLRSTFYMYGHLLC